MHVHAMRHLLPVGLVCGLVRVASGEPPPPPLSVVQTIPLPGVERRIDHLAVDPAGKRLFVSALGNHTLEVLDVDAGKRITSIQGLKEPQGVAYVAGVHRIVVAMRGGSVAAFDDEKYERKATLPDTGDADNLRYDAAAGQLYLGYGEGALGVLDPESLKLVASIPVGAHPESFRLEEQGPRIFVNVPDKREIVVVDRKERKTLKHIPLAPKDNFPMSLDEAGHRLFVGMRRPAQLLVFDTETGKQLAAVSCVGDTDDLFYDAKRDRVYVIGGEGYVDVFDAAASGKYDRIARLKTRDGARTGLWSPELDRLFVALPNRSGKPAEIDALGPAGT
jgi:DNA-binding beta-propeller fold protein YncE